MHISNATRYALGVCAALRRSLAAARHRYPCPREPIGQNAMLAVRPDRGRSWMAPDAKKDNLVYISDLGTG